MKLFSKVKKDCNGNEGIFYYKDKKLTILHREDGPAIEYRNGTKHWFVNGEKHRIDGPATEWFDGSKEYYINGEYFFHINEYLEEIAKIKFGGFV